MMNINQDETRQKFEELLPFFNRVCNNAVESLTILLKANNITFLSIVSRVKAFDSFFEKTKQKNYKNPFLDNEDFCGVRIILYYLNDIAKVNEIIKSEFDVKDNFNKEDKLDVNEFGYRSSHFIAKFNKKWCSTPNYRGLENIKFEIQVRTVLMHTWAEIEHKLGYKAKDQAPKELQRKLFMLSAKLEEADGQFQEIKTKSEEYQNSLIDKAKEIGKFSNKEFDLNTFQALLDFYFPDYEKSVTMSANLYQKILKYDLPLNTIVDYATKISKYSTDINNLIYGNKDSLKTTQTNLLQYAIEAFYPKADLSRCSTGRLTTIEKIKKLLRQ